MEKSERARKVGDLWLFPDRFLEQHESLPFVMVLKQNKLVNGDFLQLF